MAQSQFEKLVQKAAAQDARRIKQIDNQKTVINRLLERIRVLEGEGGDLMGKRKDAFMAGFEAGETEDDAQQAWEEYKAEQESGDESGDTNAAE